MKRNVCIACIACFCFIVLVAGCSGGGSYNDPASLPKPPNNPGTAEQLADTAWDTPMSTLSFYPNGIVAFQPKQANAPRMTGSYSVNDGVVMATIMGVEPIAATWDGSKLVIQGVECSPLGKPEPMQ